MTRRTRMQLPWMATVQVGDILKSRSGLYRIVRAVHRYPDGDLRSVSFTIKHCSWTRACHTVYDFTMLRASGYNRVGRMKRPLDSQLDQNILHDIERPGIRERRLTCCDVEGVA